MRPCTICTHSKSADIDRRLERGDRLTTISRVFVVSRQALMRHRDRHTASAVEAAAKEMSTARTGKKLGNLGLTEILAHLRDNVADCEAAAKKRGDVRSRLAAVAQMTKLIELTLKAEEIGSGASEPATGTPAGGGYVIVLPDNHRGDDAPSAMVPAVLPTIANDDDDEA